MAELSTIARPYARALFDLVRQEGDFAAWESLLEGMVNVAANSDVQRLVLDPKIAREQLHQVFVDVLGTNLTPVGERFLGELITRGRLAALPEIFYQFKQLSNAHRGFADALIETAFPIDAGALGELVVALEKKFSLRLNPSVVISPELIGGVRVTVGDEVLDTSVRAHLEQMKTALMA